MRISALAASLVIIGAAPSVAQAQQSPFAVAVSPSAQARSANLPSSPILPMSNPILPITNPILPMKNPVAPITTSPVQPIIPIPFIRDPGTGNATVVVPGPSDRSPEVGRRTEGRRPERGRQRAVTVPVLVIPYLYSDQPVDLIMPSPIPGKLPGANPGRAAPSDPPVNRDSSGESDRTDTFTYFAQPSLPQPQLIDVNPPAGPRLPPPALGMPRSEVLARYGKPWGTVLARNQETLYFAGDLVVVIQDGVVIQVR